MPSAIISNAPWIASSEVATTLSLFSLSSSDKLSIFIKSFAISSIGRVSSWAKIISANGSKPLAFATVALVFFFCLKGLYKSSTYARVSADAIETVNSSVNFPCSSIDFTTSSLRVSRFLR